MRIADHCRPGARGNIDGWLPRCPWPAHVYVQWGGDGLVLGRNGVYRTAFFEAFPREPDTYIRGEGATVEDAERAAFTRYQRITACPGHEFERRGYRSGAGFCKHCGMFASRAFEPLERCVVCNTPTYHGYGVTSDGVQRWYCEAHEHLRPRDTEPGPVDALQVD